MLALFRISSFPLAYQVSKSVPYFQKCYSCGDVNYSYKFQGGKSNKRTTDMRKQQSSVPVWRPVFTQSCSADGEFHDGDSSGSSKSQDAHGGPKVGTELAGPSIDPTTLLDKEDKPLEGSMSSTDKHSISLEVGSSLFRFIKGKGGSMQASIEEEMGVRIIFPSSRKGESIIIEGTSPDTVARASARIQLVIDEAVKSSALDYSHFISLPLAIHPQLVDKLVSFQHSILGFTDANPYEVLDNNSSNKAPKVTVTLETQEVSDNVSVDVTKIPLVSYPPKSSDTSTSKPKTSTLSELGIDKSIFIKPHTFHLTVLMLKLWNKDRVDTAVRIFKGIEAEVMDALNGQPVSIRLKGLDCMKGSLAKARVLYAPVEVVGGEDRLLRACKIMTDAFTEGGLVLEKDAKHTLKLHATVMNARHRKRKMNTKKYDTFDARDVMERYGSEDWGEYLIPEVHLSQRFVFDENGYYHCCASIPLPKHVHVQAE